MIPAFYRECRDFQKAFQCGAIQSLTISDTVATAPTPPSQNKANHAKRWASGRAGGLAIINDSRSQV